jgi:hypothetical protein
LADCVLSEAGLPPESVDRVRETLRLWSRHAPSA